jgi:ABC-type proline/glycine betaine transport system substrate-binding protein
MKKLASVLAALGLAVGSTAPIFAADAPKNKADCHKAHMKWDSSTKACS